MRRRAGCLLRLRPGKSYQEIVAFNERRLRNRKHQQATPEASPEPQNGCREPTPGASLKLDGGSVVFPQELAEPFTVTRITIVKNYQADAKSRARFGLHRAAGNCLRSCSCLGLG